MILTQHAEPVNLGKEQGGPLRMRSMDFNLHTEVISQDHQADLVGQKSVFFMGKKKKEKKGRRRRP
tara:strand:+ start:2407 stop:2604 length:198 start_codon:yes stop_codon:yes gene_type:complete